MFELEYIGNNNYNFINIKEKQFNRKKTTTCRIKKKNNFNQIDRFNQLRVTEKEKNTKQTTRPIMFTPVIMELASAALTKALFRQSIDVELNN